MMNLKDAASYALEQLQKAGADDAAVIVTSGKIDELNIDGGEFSLMRSGFKSGLSLKAIKEQKTGNIHTNSCEKEAIDAAVKDCMAAVHWNTRSTMLYTPPGTIWNGVTD